MTQPADRFTEIEAQVAAAEQALLAATGGTNVCQLDKAGPATGGAKYQEGRLVALRTARRLVQSADPARALAQVQQLFRRPPGGGERGAPQPDERSAE